jgi:Domain of unknown function (DUF6378)
MMMRAGAHFTPICVRVLTNHVRMLWLRFGTVRYGFPRSRFFNSLPGRFVPVQFPRRRYGTVNPSIRGCTRPRSYLRTRTGARERNARRPQRTTPRLVPWQHRLPDRWAWVRPMNGEQLLEHAAGLVNRRRREYGEPVDLFEQIAKRWSLTLGTGVSPAQVTLCLIDLKLTRLSHDPKHLDSQIDLAGYTACLREVTR